MGDLEKYGRKVWVSMTPPLIVAGIRRVRDHLLRSRQPSTLPDPAEYSAIDNPVEVPCQVEAYLLCRDEYLKPTDVTLDVGFGLGYGLQIMAGKVKYLVGLEVDTRAIDRAGRLFEGHPQIKAVVLYRGDRFPFKDKSFDAVTCIEVIEHVEDYKRLLTEMARVSRRLVLLSTPNRRPADTLKDGAPKNYWHRREWTKDELEEIFAQFGFKWQWHFLNGPFKGPFTVTEMERNDTLTLVPIIDVGS